MKAPMLTRLKTYLNTTERRLRTSFGNDISTPKGRRAAFWNFQLMDHAFLRVLWENLHQIMPGVWRSNQPSPRRIARYRKMGIVNIITLRGNAPRSHYLFEQEACQAQGITLVHTGISARTLAPRKALLRLLDLFDTLERPLLMHCKSGADRAGLAAALYLMHVGDVPVAVAARQLSLRYLHLKNDKTGILDHMLDAYADDCGREPIAIRDWIETRYDPKALTASFAKARRRGKHKHKAGGGGGAGADD